MSIEHGMYARIVKSQYINPSEDMTIDYGKRVTAEKKNTTISSVNYVKGERFLPM
tara:strand:+ start:716 stop:880 length:165 start_codon:yes stop_codon:yes gene_type:complete